MTRSTVVTIHVPAPLREYCGGVPALATSASSVREALTELERAQPALFRAVCDDTGAVRRHVNLFVNRDHIRDRDGVETKLVAGDVLTILPAVSGG